MLIESMKFQPKEPQNELTSIFDSVLRADFDFKLSMPYSDSDDQFFSLVQCLKILENSKQKYIKRLESELKKLEYGDDTYEALLATMERGESGSLDVSKKRTRNLIDECLLVEAQKITNFGNLFRSHVKNDDYKVPAALEAILDEFGAITKEMEAQISLIPPKKRNETKKNFQTRLKKELSARYKKSALFSWNGGMDARTRLIYFQDKFIPLVFPMSQFPLHATSKKVSTDAFAKLSLGSMFIILAEKTYEVHSRLSQEYFAENDHVYQKIDSLLQTYRHNEININHSVSLVQLLLKGLDAEINKSRSKISPWNSRNRVNINRLRDFNHSQEMAWARLNAPFYDLRLQPERFWDFLKKDLSDPRINERLLRSFSSFSDGFSGNSLHNKVQAENKLAKNLMERINKHQATLKKPLAVPAWLKTELSNYYAKSYTQDNKDKNDIDYYETLPLKSLEGLCTSLVGGFARDENKIIKNLKKLRKHKNILRDKKLSLGRYTRKTREWVQKNIPDHLLKYLDQYYEHDSFKDLQKISHKIDRLNKTKNSSETLTPDEYYRLRVSLINTTIIHLRLQDLYYSEDKKKKILRRKGRSIIPRVDMVPEKLFTLEKTYEKSFDKNTIDLMTEVIHIIEQNPVIGLKLIKLIVDEKFNCPKYIARENWPDDISWQEKHKAGLSKKMFLDQVINYVNAKIDSMNNTHTYSMADSLSRIFLIANGLCPYKGNEGNDTYQKIINEIKNLNAFFELYLEGLIQSYPPSHRTVSQKLLVWEIINNLKAIEKYFLTLEHAQIDVENKPEIAGLNNDFSLEQLYLISKKREQRRVLDKESIATCLDGKLFKKNYQKYNYIHKEIKKKKLEWSTNSLGKNPIKYNDRLKRDSAINWLKVRPGNARYRDLRNGDWTEDVGYYHFSLTHLNNTK